MYSIWVLNILYCDMTCKSSKEVRNYSFSHKINPTGFQTLCCVGLKATFRKSWPVIRLQISFWKTFVHRCKLCHTTKHSHQQSFKFWIGIPMANTETYRISFPEFSFQCITATQTSWLAPSLNFISQITRSYKNRCGLKDLTESLINDRFVPAQSKAGLSVRFAHFTMCVKGSCLCNNSLHPLRK